MITSTSLFTSHQQSCQKGMKMVLNDQNNSIFFYNVLQLSWSMLKMKPQALTGKDFEDLATGRQE